MNKKILKSILMLGIIYVILLILTTVSNATLSISTSKSSVSPGESFNVTVSVSSSEAGAVDLSVSNGTLSKTYIDLMTQTSVTVNCKAGSSGTVTISASGKVANYTTETEKTQSASKTVKIVQPTSNSNGTSSGGSSGSNSSNSGNTSSNNKPTTNTTTQTVTKSTDSSLKLLEVAEGTITPEFSKTVKEYTLTVPYDVTSVNVTATQNDSKAKVAVTGNTDLQEGENTVTVTVTAEDGTKTNYTIKVTRTRVPLALQSLIIKYEDQEGNLIEMPLNPVFAFDTVEYKLEDLEYWVEKLSIEAIANIEGATIDIEGADNLHVGENTIIITAKIATERAEDLEEGEELEEEKITYTIKVNKNEEPTLLAKISNWFKGIFGGITEWYNQNENNVLVGALLACIVALFGLSIYIILDYNKYKDVIKKLKKVTEINSTNETVAEQVQEISENTEFEEKIQGQKDKSKTGKRFK